MEDSYLGDGVYASYDGYYIWLDLRAQNQDIEIALEPTVMENLFRYYQLPTVMENLFRYYQFIKDIENNRT